MLRGVGQHALAAFAELFDESGILPRCENLESVVQRLVTDLESHLVITLTRCTMRHGASTGSVRHLNLMLRNQRPGNRCSHQIPALVLAMAPQARQEVIA